jgi:hypothetical protein
LLENLFVKKIRKGKKNSEIRIPTFVKSDVSTSSTLTDAFLDMHIKLIGTKWETLSRELFHYFVHKDAWIFKGGSLSKGIHPLFFKDHSRSLDEAVKNKQFLKDVPTGLLAYLAIEKATNTLEGSKEIKRVNQKNSSFLSPILNGEGFHSKNFFKLEETQIQSLIENGYMEIREGKFKVLTPPLYHKFSVQVAEGVYDTKTMKLETVTISVGGKQYILNAKDYFANRDKIYNVVEAKYVQTVTGNEKSLSLPLTQNELTYNNLIDFVPVEYLKAPENSLDIVLQEGDVRTNIFTYKGKTIETEFVLGKEQEQVLKDLIDFVQQGNTNQTDRDVITLQGQAGCLGIGTKVLMYNGSFKQVEDVVVGDQLMGIDSTPRTVLELKRGVEQMYKIHQTKGISYRVNESHILSLKEIKPQKYSRLTLTDGSRISNTNKPLTHNTQTITRNISVRDYLELIEKRKSYKKEWKGYSVGVEFESKTVSIDPYYYGLWVGDGHTNSIKTITNTDVEVINYLSTNFGIRRINGGITYTIEEPNYSKYFKDLYGLSNADKLESKYIHSNYLYNSKEIRLQVLAGIIDSDGSWSESGKAYEVTFKSKQLAEDLTFLTRSLGFKTKLTPKIATCKACKEDGYPVYRVTFSPECIIPTKISYKTYQGDKSNFKNRLHTGISVERDVIDNYYGFVLDGDHLFLLEDFTVTHNTGKTSLIGYLQKYLKDRYSFAYLAPTHAATAELALATVKTGNIYLPSTVTSSITYNAKKKTHVFSAKVQKKLLKSPVIVVDESSMLDNSDIDKLKEAAIETGASLIFMGDEKQIPKVTKDSEKTKPVSKAFTDFRQLNLTKIFRQSENSLLFVLNKIRQQTDFKLFKTKNTEAIQFLNKKQFNEALTEDVLNSPESTVVVSYTNNSVKAQNQSLRALLGREGETQVGDIVMGYLGYASKQIEKGDIANSISYTIDRIEEEGTGRVLYVSSKKLQSLVEAGIVEISKTANTIYYQLSNSDSLTFDSLSSKEFEINNDIVSGYFRTLHNANVRLENNTMTYGDYLETIAGISEALRKVSVGDSYVFNPSSNRMEKYNPTTHRGIKTSGQGSLLLEKDIDYGHAITIHKSQGTTIENVYFDASSLSYAPNTQVIDSNGKQITTEKQALAYVAMSRSKNKLVVYEGDISFEMIEVPKTEESVSNSEENIVETANLNVEQQQDVVGQIYSEISKYSENQTQSKYVILPKDVDPEADNIGMTYTTAIDFWRNIVPEAVALFNKSKPLIVAFRGNSKKTFLENYKSGTHTIGNPFDWRDETQTKDRKEQGIASTKKFIEWMITGNSFENENATEEYRQTIITDIKSGKIKGSSILYYEEKGYATHATALDFLINKYDWNQQQPNLNQQGSKDSVKKDFIRVKGYFITTNYENSYDGSFINYRVYNNNNEYFFNYYENSRVSVPNEISWHLNQKGINISWDDVEEMFKNIDKNNDIYKELEESKKLNQPLPPTPNQSTEEGTDATCPIS